jgi:hypothetical protein
LARQILIQGPELIAGTVVLIAPVRGRRVPGITLRARQAPTHLGTHRFRVLRSASTPSSATQKVLWGVPGSNRSLKDNPCSGFTVSTAVNRGITIVFQAHELQSPECFVLQPYHGRSAHLLNGTPACHSRKCRVRNESVWLFPVCARQSGFFPYYYYYNYHYLHLLT